MILIIAVAVTFFIAGVISTFILAIGLGGVARREDRS